MPRGRAPGYELQREAIVARAAELFARQGYSGTSMNQVAEACGISKPSLYHYVDDKYQLLVEIAQGHVDRLRALVKEAPGAAPDAGSEGARADRALHGRLCRCPERAPGPDRGRALPCAEGPAARARR